MLDSLQNEEPELRFVNFFYESLDTTMAAIKQREEVGLSASPTRYDLNRQYSYATNTLVINYDAFFI